MSVEIWSTIGTIVGTLVFLVVPGVVYAWYVLGLWLGRRQGQLAAPAPRVAPPSIRPVPVEMGDSLRGIADPELRECLSALAGAVAATSGPPRIGRINDKD